MSSSTRTTCSWLARICGPIGNPSREAIDAVLSPPPVPYLYFVARGDGSHEFSSDLRSHNMAVRKYLK